MMPGLKPMRASRSAKAMTIGVLPVPPTRMLPTIMMGTAWDLFFSIPRSFMKSRVRLINPYNQDSGHSARLVGPRLSQNVGALLKRILEYLAGIKSELLFVAHYFFV
jgi:hypothetical protein